MNSIYLFLLALTFVAIQCMMGGTLLIFSLPCYGLLALASALTVFSLRRKKVAPCAFCLGGAALLGAVVFVRSAFSPVHELALPDFFRMGGCLMVYGLTAFYVTRATDRMILLAVLFALAIAEVWVGAVQFTHGNNFMLFGLIRAENGRRASGMFVSPNHFGGFIEAIGIFALSLTVWSKWRLWAKIFAGYVAIFCWLGVAISGSRGSYFSTIFSLLAFSALSLYAVRVLSRPRFWLIGISLLVALVLLIGMAAFLMFHSSLLSERMRTMVAHDVRLYNWQAAWDQFRMSPLVGTGSGTHLIYGRLFRRMQIQTDPVHAHSDYLELLAEYGLIGATAMIFFLVMHVRNGWRAYLLLIRKRLLPSYYPLSDSFALVVGSLSAVVALAVHSVVDFNMHIPGNALFYAFVFGIIANPGFGREDDSPARIAPLFRFALPLLGLWIGVAALPKIPAEYFTEKARVELRDGNDFGSMDDAHIALGEIPDNPGLMERLVEWSGGSRLNPFLYFYVGEANRALALSTVGRAIRDSYYEDAVDAYQKGLKLFPDDENLLIRCAQSLDGLREFSEAEDLYDAALKADPNLGVLYGYYGSHLAAMGRTADANAAYEKGNRLSSTSIERVGRQELGLEK